MQIMIIFLFLTQTLIASSKGNTPEEEAPCEYWLTIAHAHGPGVVENKVVANSYFLQGAEIGHTYLCGIELDGKDHLRQSARDRDIERQAILESKGWTILRVWSIDFFDDMEGEYQILKLAIGEIFEKKRVKK